MANNLTNQVRNIAQVTTAVAQGDLGKKIDVDARGEILELKTTINTMVDQLSGFADEVTRVAREVGTEGNLGGQARVRGASGTWKDLTDNVNVMANNLTGQVRSIARVATAVASGDLTKKITVEAKGEVAALAETFNGMVDTLSAFADEVTRVAGEVGTEGMLGGQARVPGVAGTWKELTDRVNVMADNLTSQVRNIAQVTTAVANGDLTRRIDVDARGEILELKTTLNTMVDRLSAFASEVTRVAREVGTEGKLGGQATVEDVSGTWQRLTESVNQLASNLTTQVRAIAEVATAVTEGDLTRAITVDASGEVADLKDNINQMIANLRATTNANQEQDWLNTNLARIAGLLPGRRDLTSVAAMVLEELAPLVSAHSAAFFLAESEEDGPLGVAEEAADVRLRMIAGFGYAAAPGEGPVFAPGQGLVGQVAVSKKTVALTGAPAGYVPIRSGLGADRRHQRHRAAGALRAADARRDRAGLGQRVHPDPPRLPGDAQGDDRHRGQHHHHQRPHRRAAARVPAPDHRAAEAAERPAGVEQRAGGQGRAAGPAEQGHRDQEHRDRAGAPDPGGPRPAARPGLQGQVRVHGQHVARAAHAAEQHADPGPAAGRQRRRQPDRRARWTSPRPSTRPARTCWS